jgi:RimJ/RimL family protein N-acetyltransferase
MPDSLRLAFEEVGSTETAAVFLSSHRWPFHGRSVLTLEQARQVKLAPAESARAFWIRDQGRPVGLLRIFDLEDAEHGSVQFDLRIAEDARGRGVGSATVAWLIQMLFAEYPRLHRIEAATRFDNVAMRRVLERNHFALEGQLRETWRSEDGRRYDTALYGRLRSDAP